MSEDRYQDLRFLLRAFTRLILFQTYEEDRFLKGLKEIIKSGSCKVFNPAFGLQDIDTVIADWKLRKSPENKSQFDINQVLDSIYKEDPKGESAVYVILDAERFLKDAQDQNSMAHRRLLNIAHQVHNDEKMVKTIIFVSHRRVIPEKLSRYFEVVVDRGLTEKDVIEVVSGPAKSLGIPVPKDPYKLFRGMTAWEVESAIAQSVIHTRDKSGKGNQSIDPPFIMECRRKSLRKTDLLSYVDTKEFSFDQVGGAQRFKDWCERAKASRTDAGRKFGLKPPKGVLAVGVWGCGKSLSVKAMGQSWGIPVVAMEMGKFRSGQVGQSESNVYQAINLIESIGDCIVWIDEAEKSLSGGQSSAATDSGTTSRMIGILSTWLQETSAPVTLALTANTLSTLPVEFVNRMDERFFFDLPGLKERTEIIKIHVARLGRDPKKYDLAALSEKADMLVGREIVQAVEAALRDSFHAKKADLDEGILATALEKKPRISRTMVDEIQSLIQWVGYDPVSDDGIRARYANPPTKRATGGALSVVEGTGE